MAWDGITFPVPGVIREDSHGHVFENKDHSRCRCGGPGVCKVCQQELAEANTMKAGVSVEEKRRVFYPNTYITTPTLLPDEGDYYLVISTDMIHIEGDERSRRNPGHGYPAYQKAVPKIMLFTDENKLKDWIETNEGAMGRSLYKIVKGRTVKMKTKIDISLE